MARRRWLVLLLFAAVFAMHGVECIDTGNPTAGASHHSMTAAAAASASAHGSGPGFTESFELIVASTPTAALSPAAVSATPGMLDSGGHPMGLMGHLWTVCLAVLSVGLAVLLAARAVVNVRSRRPLPHGGFPCPRAQIRGRSPDLVALCVLRI